MCVSKVQHVTGRKTGYNRSRPVFFGFSIFRQTSQLATEKIQNLCNRNRWSGLLRLGSVRFRSFFQSSKLDLRTLEFNNIDSVNNRMRFMLGNVTHHQNQILPGTQEALSNGLGWDVICPTPPLPSAASQPPTSELSRTQNVQAKKKVNWEDSAPWEDIPTGIEQGRNIDEGLEPSFSFQTPFKKGTHFFDTSADGLSSAYFSTPGLSLSTPDVIVGLATPSRTDFGENVREYGANQGTSMLTVTRQIPNPTQSVTTAPTNNFVKNSNPFAMNNSNRTPHVPTNRGGGNDPPGGGGNGPPTPGGGGDGPPNQGGGGGPSNGFSNSPPRTPQFYNNPGGGSGGCGGGGGGGNPGGGGGPHPHNNDTWPPAPYGNMPASIKTELKVEQLLEWDGNHWTAIDYFWQIQQLAYLGGWLPKALGYWLWFQLKDSLPIRCWFVTLPIAHQSYMRSHYLRFLKGIKDGFLGHRWQLKMNNYYNAQSFRERNHKRESPSEFIIRQIIYTRMLLSVDAGGPLEVFYIMRKAPVSWGPILLLSSVKDSSELFSRVTEHEEALLEAYHISRGGQTPSIDNIVTQLKQMGFLQERPAQQ